MSRPQFRPAWRSTALALGLLWSAGSAQAATYTALTDAIPYASWNAAAPQMDDVWSPNTGTTPVLAAGYFTFGNGVIHQTLPVTATQNFELKVDALHGAYSRTIWVGLFNAAGTQGYALLWNSAAGPAPAQGVVSIRKYNVAGPGSLLFNTYGTLLGSTPASGHPATTGALAQLKLTWNSATSTLTLSVDGVVKSTVVDSTYSSFSRIFVAGNDSAAPAKIDNLSVTLDDSTAPTVALTAPVGGTTVSGTVALSATASDGIGLAGVQFKLNNTTNLGAEDTTAAYGVNWDTTTFENGVYQLTAVARDLAGNLTTSTPVRVFVKNTSSPGAVVPWTYYEAEDAVPNGGATQKVGTTWGATGNQAAFEAHGKQCVLLDATGENIVWSNVVAATHLTVRYALDSEASSGTLALYVNGLAQPALAVTGARTRETKPTANVPLGEVRFWDEVMVPVTIPNNATVELRYNGVACLIDFIELETAPAALNPPDGTWVSVASGTGDARARIVAAIATANAVGGSQKVWFPAGTYTVEMGLNSSGVPTPSETIKVPSGTELRGAGIWHTTIVKNWGGSLGRLFSFFQKTGITARDMKVVDTITTLSGNPSSALFLVDQSVDCVLQNIWTEYGTLASAYGTTRLTVRDCRVRNGYKDAIHIANGSQGGLIENCTFRNTGDDCAAFVMYQLTPPVSLNGCTARYNTMEGTYWGRSVSLQGGDSILAEYNLVRDCSMAGIMVAIDGWKQTPTDPTIYWGYNTNFTVRNNVVIRCGNQTSVAAGAAISVWTPTSILRPMSGTITLNAVLDPPFHASQLVGNVGDGTHVVNFQNNALELPTTVGGPPWERKFVTNLLAGSNCNHTPNVDL